MLDCRALEFIEACEGLRASERYIVAWKLLSPFHYKTLRSICVSGCARHGGNWMAQTLGHTLTNWRLIMHGWPRLSSQALQGALPICCLDTYSWNWVGMCFVALLVFACVPKP